MDQLFYVGFGIVLLIAVVIATAILLMRVGHWTPVHDLAKSGSRLGCLLVGVIGVVVAIIIISTPWIRAAYPDGGTPTAAPVESNKKGESQLPFRRF